MNLDNAMKSLQRSIKRLGKSEGRIARRNARKVFARQMKLVKTIVDRDFPKIAKPKVERPEPAAEVKEEAFRLPVQREWTVAARDLFARIARSGTARPVPVVRVHTGSTFRCKIRFIT